jgi:lipopolysaccharide/colanic/teichoic acid biosynthesis glycosyltransferase
VGALSRAAAALAILLTWPFALFAALKTKLSGGPVLRPLLAVRPRASDRMHLTGDTLLYYELNGAQGGLRRWPQLWKIVRGEFAWIGNRPLSPNQANGLINDFERLWLAAPLGLISLADVEGCTEFFADETRAHASYYAARANRRLDLAIFVQALFLAVSGLPYARVREQLAHVFHRARGPERRAHLS